MLIGLNLCRLTVRLTLGSVDTEAVNSIIQEVIGVSNELTADVLVLCSQAAVR